MRLSPTVKRYDMMWMCPHAAARLAARTCVSFAQRQSPPPAGAPNPLGELTVVGLHEHLHERQVPAGGGGGHGSAALLFLSVSPAPIRRCRMYLPDVQVVTAGLVKDPNRLESGFHCQPPA